jgi:hypothetical protein
VPKIWQKWLLEVFFVPWPGLIPVVQAKSFTEQILGAIVPLPFQHDMGKILGEPEQVLSF